MCVCVYMYVCVCVCVCVIQGREIGSLTRKFKFCDCGGDANRP